MLRRVVIGATMLLLGGCLMNDVTRYDDGTPSRLSPRRAYVLIGTGVAEGVAPAYPFSLHFQEYSREEGRITGDCFNWDRIETRGLSGPTPTRFELFAAPPGAYSRRYGGNAAPEGFVARAGQVVYVGTYVLQGERLRQPTRPFENGGQPYREPDVGRFDDVEAARAWTASRRYPAPIAAETFAAPGGGMMFLCTP